MPAWMKLTAYDRAKVLKKTADLMRERADAIARTLTMEQGKPLAEAKAEVLHSADTFEWFAEEGKRAYGQVIPNSHAGQTAHHHQASGRRGRRHQPVELPDHAASRKIAPALAAGCTIVCKPASQTPLCLMQVFECMIEAGLPAGVANLVMGPAQEIAEEFLENPNLPQDQLHRLDRGRQATDDGGRRQVKRLSLELGGHAPFIVFPDADRKSGPRSPSWASSATTARCASPRAGSTSTRTMPEEIHRGRRRVRQAALKVGNGLDAGIEIGPMFEKRAMDNTLGLIEDARKKGAKVLTGGKRDRPLRQGLLLRADHRLTRSTAR